ncbi:hypothetical protein B0J14DRAFT_588018 [Halenospora varia]|nr:hypothetical protein B0J14DRAFT_588018 [Halenospora varia]
MKLTYFQTIFLLAPSLINAKPLVMRGTADHIETPEEFAAGTDNLQATGSCRAYLSTKQDLTICASKCASTPPEDAATVGVLSSTSCVWTSNGMDNDIFTDPTMNQYHIGQCECNIPLLDQLVGTVVMALPAIGEIACSVLFNSFDKVIEIGLLVIPEGKVLDASVEAGVKAAKTILENGEKASSFAQWFDPCGPKVAGAHDYAADIDALFQQYTSIPDTVVKGSGCKGGKCPDAASTTARDTLSAAAAGKGKPKGPDPVKPSAPVEKPSAPPVQSVQKPSVSAEKPTVAPTTAAPVTSAAPITTAIPTTAISSVIPSVVPTTVLSSVASSLVPTGVSSIVSSAVPSQASSVVSSILPTTAVSSVLSTGVSSILPTTAVTSILSSAVSSILPSTALPTTLLTSALPTTLSPTPITSAPPTETSGPAEGVCAPFDIACLNGQLDPLRSITDALSLTLFPSSTGAPFPITANSTAVVTSSGIEVTATAVGGEVTAAPSFTTLV